MGNDSGAIRVSDGVAEGAQWCFCGTQFPIRPWAYRLTRALVLEARMLYALSDWIIERFPKISAPLRWMRTHRKTRRTIIIVGFHILGALTSIDAILGVRTSQGAIAWAVSLNTIPYVAVPAYWIFGRSNFEGYVLLRRKAEAEYSDTERQVAEDVRAMRPAPGDLPPAAALLENLAKM